MSTDLGPGDWVECVKAVPGTPEFSIGSVWCVAEAVHEPDAECVECRSNLGALRFVNDPWKNPWTRAALGWCPCKFRPFRGPEQSELGLTAPAPAEPLPTSA